MDGGRSNVTLLRLVALCALALVLGLRLVGSMELAARPATDPEAASLTTVSRAVSTTVGNLWDARPRCVLKRTTGIACPTCGSTRAVERLGRGDLLGALAANFLTTGALVGAIVLGAVSLGWPTRTLGWTGALARAVASPAGRLGVIVLLVLQVTWLNR